MTRFEVATAAAALFLNACSHAAAPAVVAPPALVARPAVVAPPGRGETGAQTDQTSLLEGACLEVIDVGSHIACYRDHVLFRAQSNDVFLPSHVVLETDEDPPRWRPPREVLGLSGADARHLTLTVRVQETPGSEKSFAARLLTGEELAATLRKLQLWMSAGDAACRRMQRCCVAAMPILNADEPGYVPTEGECDYWHQAPDRQECAQTERELRELLVSRNRSVPAACESPTP
ncbi:MAG: hypothetical protein IPK60_07760 [Sandaracinaceae bacterium]|nr:hypothetical protein [Sandaracinaceae bacterium]